MMKTDTIYGAKEHSFSILQLRHGTLEIYRTYTDVPESNAM
jgi:hypothetical protein